MSQPLQSYIKQAVREKNIECAKFLVENGAIVGVLNSKDRTVYDIAKGLHKKFREPMLELLDSARKVATPIEDVPAPSMPFFWLPFMTYLR